MLVLSPVHLALWIALVDGLGLQAPQWCCPDLPSARPGQRRHRGAQGPGEAQRTACVDGEVVWWHDM
eukprot:1278228-Alexandrium_andersonii.AAC.1